MIVTHSVPLGNYTVAELLTELNNLWNPDNITFSYNSNTFKYTISVTDAIPISIDTSNSDMLDIIGFSGYDD